MNFKELYAAVKEIAGDELFSVEVEVTGIHGAISEVEWRVYMGGFGRYEASSPETALAMLKRATDCAAPPAFPDATGVELLAQEQPT